MQDFEQLGEFYLGREHDLAAGVTKDRPLLYDSKDLTTHAVCVGMTGSGKTGLCLSLLEEAAVDGVPAIAIDPKGDLGNLLLAFPQLQPADFEPWIDPHVAARKDLTVSELAEQTAALWQNGLQKWNQDGQRISRFNAAVDKATHLEILVNNGLSVRNVKDLWSTDFAGFAEHQHNNAGYFILARHLRDHIAARRRTDDTAAGSVINIGSMYGQVASYPDAYEGVFAASPVAYHALKGGTIHMTRHLAVYWAKDHVRVNCLSPGPFPHDGIPEEMVRRLCTKSPMARMGKPHELKGALLLLASDAGSYITGQNINVDGGWMAW